MFSIIYRVAKSPPVLLHTNYKFLFIYPLVIANKFFNIYLYFSTEFQSCRFNAHRLKHFTIYRSHCTCDKALYQCLKAANHPTANLLGQIYFNIVKVECIEDIQTNQHIPSESSRKFVPVKKEY